MQGKGVCIRLVGEKTDTLARVDQWNESFCILILRGGIPKKVFHKYIESCTESPEVDWGLRGEPYQSVPIESRYKNKARGGK